MAGAGMIIGKALEGWGTAKLDALKAQREERLNELREARADKRAADDREFRAREAEIGRKFESGENDKTRKFQSTEAAAGRTFSGTENEKERTFRASESDEDRSFRSGEARTERDWRSGEGDKERQHQSDEKMLDRDTTVTENEKTRKANAEIVTGEDGTNYIREGDTVKPLTDKDGKPVKLAGAAKDKPAEVATAEWLVQNGVATDAASAWKLVRAARADPEKSRASIYKAWLTALKPEFGDVKDPAALEAAARANTEKTMEYLESEEAPSTMERGGMVPKKGPEKVEAKKSEEAAAKEGDIGTSANQIPANPSERVPNKIYMKNGKMYRWVVEGDQAGWEPVK